MRITIVLLLTVLIYGCGATSNISYVSPNQNSPIEKSVTIDRDFDDTWNKMVENLSSDFLIINNLEKDSGLINVSFSSNSPSTYVTCGSSQREFKNLRGEQRYIYDPAESTRYTMTNGPAAFNVVRNSSLNGRANIYLSENDKKTTIRVNAQFSVDVDINYYELATGRFANKFSTAFTPSTSKAFTTDDGVTCLSTGELEGVILSYTR